MDLLGFRLELVHLLLKQRGSIRSVVRARKVARDAAQRATVCELDLVSNIVDLKRGRCHYCQIKKKKPQLFAHLEQQRRPSAVFLRNKPLC